MSCGLRWFDGDPGWSSQRFGKFANPLTLTQLAPAILLKSRAIAVSFGHVNLTIPYDSSCAASGVYSCVTPLS